MSNFSTEFFLLTGGPAVLKESDGNDTLIGINYESIRNAYHGELQVSAQVAYFLDFIDQVTLPDDRTPS